MSFMAYRGVIHTHTHTHPALQACTRFVFAFAEETRMQALGPVTPGYNFMARLRWVSVYTDSQSWTQEHMVPDLPSPCPPNSVSLHACAEAALTPSFPSTHTHWPRDGCMCRSPAWRTGGATWCLVSLLGTTSSR